MAKQRYDFEHEFKSFNKRTRAIIVHAQKVLGEYAAQGYILTLRQLYYQFVVRELIANDNHWYKMVGTAVKKGRMVGVLDWAMIEDRGRRPIIWNQWSSVEKALNERLDEFTLRLWDRQENYVEVWTEKDALSEIIRTVAGGTLNTVVINKGYTSTSAMRASAQRFISEDKGGRNVLLYLGDHDPSGLDMIRDIGERLKVFEAGFVEVRHIALTMDQIDEYQPPPNPAKLTDKRARAYIEEFGDSSWEVDALEPAVLASLISDEISDLIEWDLWDEDVERSDKQKAAGRAAIDALDFDES